MTGWTFRTGVSQEDVPFLALFQWGHRVGESARCPFGPPNPRAQEGERRKNVFVFQSRAGGSGRVHNRVGDEAGWPEPDLGNYFGYLEAERVYAEWSEKISRQAPPPQPEDLEAPSDLVGGLLAGVIHGPETKVPERTCPPRRPDRLALPAEDRRRPNRRP
jgi:hypothetical protein